MQDYDALDRYLLRRYPTGRRMASVAAKALVPVGLLARRQVPGDAADVLLLHPHAGAVGRHADLAASLEARGLAVGHEVVPDAWHLLRSRRLATPLDGWRAVPRRWRLQSAYAGWLVARYRPAVLATFMDDSLHTPFLRESMAAHGGVLVNIAHAMFWPSMDFSMCDADWLLLWGRRSLENLRAAPVRFGRCRALTIGSIYLRGAAERRAGPAPAGRMRVLWIGQDLRSAHRAALEADARAFGRSMAKSPRFEVTLRAHPLDRGELRRLLGAMLPAARWSDGASPLADALREADVAVSSFSSGLVEAAALGVPVVAFAGSGLAQAMGFADHGLPVVRGEAELAAALEAIGGDWADASRRARELASEHLFRLDDATGRCCDVLERLARKGDPAGLGFPVAVLEAKG